MVRQTGRESWQRRTDRSKWGTLPRDDKSIRCPGELIQSSAAGLNSALRNSRYIASSRDKNDRGEYPSTRCRSLQPARTRYLTKSQDGTW